MLSFIRSHVSAKRDRETAQEAASRRIETRFSALSGQESAEGRTEDLIVVGPLPVSVTRQRRPLQAD